ncbi:beta strand repeat-containing protein [Pseudahrensia aquimaris]|uniref:Beta strand repeat-containing protein n=1 Tax=Pseudahrensia aquimaris TaxID=744461 RepID=A0ABW3FFL6_9HYPH
MANIDLLNAPDFFEISEADWVSYSSTAASDPTQFVWITPDGTLVTAIGTGFTVDINGFPLTGTVSSISIIDTVNLGKTVEITGLSASLIDLVTSADKFWQTVLAGATTMTGFTAENIYITGDFRTLDGGSFTGTAETFTGSDALSGEIAGDGDRLENGAVLTAASDTFNGVYRAVFGDVASVTGGSTLIAAADTIHFTVDYTSGATDEILIYGDANNVSASTVQGGADIIDMSAIQSNLVFIVGDVDTAASVGGVGSFVNGAVDTITGGGGTNEIHADFISVRESSLANGAGDDITGGNGLDKIYGDAVYNEGNLDAGDDTIRGEGGSDMLYGDVYQNTGTLIAGDDIIFGGDGDDIIYGDLIAGFSSASSSYTGGNDTIHAGEHNDRVFGNDGDDEIHGDGGNDIIEGGQGNDILDGGTGNDTARYLDASTGVTVSLAIFGVQQDTVGSGLDTLSNFENLIGSNFDDHLTGDSGANELFGEDGDDTFVGGAGQDFFDGGLGFDTIDYTANTGDMIFSMLDPGENGYDGVAAFPSGLTETFEDIQGFLLGSGNDVFSAITADHDLALEVEGRGGDDEIRGSNGDDELRGGADDDTIEGGLGNDRLGGGQGTDTLSYENATVGITGAIFDVETVINTQGAGIDTIAGNFENLAGSDHGDNLFGNSLGNDIHGNGGDDDIDGGAGADTMIGGLGNDEYWIEDAGDSVTELAGEGYDRVYVDGLASYTLGNNVERLTFLDTGNHTATGNDLANRFDGNAGNDTFILDAGGNDIFSGGQGQDTFDARAGSLGIDIDLVSGTHGGDAAGDLFASMEVFWGSNNAAVSDTMVTGAARAKFYGFAGDDDLTGGATVDYLDGGLGNDTLNGMGARDGLRGFVGDDILTGGADRDYFQYVFAEFDHDTITDYEDGLDYLRVFSDVATAVTDFTITGNGTSSVLLTLNDGTGDNTITLNSGNGSNITIDASDFLFY